MKFQKSVIKSTSLTAFLLATLGAGLLFIGWPTSPAVCFLFVGWIPFLLLEELPLNGLGRFIWRYWGLVLWNAACTWWVCNASLAGGIAAILLNSLLMSIPFGLARVVRRYWGQVTSWISWIIFWLAFEKIHLTWELTWPWLTLGNGMAMYPQMVQWYSITGHLGGSLWILLSNLLLLQIFFSKGSTQRIWFFSFLAVLAFPLTISWHLLQKKNLNDSTAEKIRVTVIQPNIDPYNEKFDANSGDKILSKFIRLSTEHTDERTSLCIWPETALPSVVEWGHSEGTQQMNALYNFVAQRPNMGLLTGANVMEIYHYPKTVTSTHYGNGNNYYDFFNSAIYLKSFAPLQRYDKSKLVPGVERIPYPGIVVPILGKTMIDMGGSVQNIATQEERTVIWKDNIGVAPAICYESVFGSYLTPFVRNGANLIAIMTNDGWWGNTEGHRQHLHYASLRAIECHRSIARSANTGISATILPTGEITEQLGWWKEGAIESELPIFKDETLFVKYGNVFEWEFVALAAILLLVLISEQIIKIII
ncbi:MAG: apolipoprotein N-acyltransferase [Chitinophagales bacterium]|nr:apolipoprotein N-acyltransferase [Chitinophagales bacterium]